MKKLPGDDAGGKGLPAVLRHFPAHAAQITELLTHDENFRSMCDDLAAAEEALAAVEHLPEHVRAQRRAEYEALVGELVSEIERALRSIKVTTLGRPERH